MASVSDITVFLVLKNLRNFFLLQFCGKICACNLNLKNAPGLLCLLVRLHNLDKIVII